MKIVKLEAENIKRIKAVEITPKGAMVRISGRNGAGKSSVLDAIAYALGGKSLHCETPVRQGEKSAKVVCETEELVVTRTFTAEGGTSLTVEGRDGARLASPQAVLDKLYGSLSFDPLVFSRLAVKAQAETLRRAVKLDLSDLDTDRAADFEERTAVNRRVKELAAQAMAAVKHHDAPEVEVSVEKLMGELDAVQKHNALQVETIRGVKEHEADALSFEANIKLRMEKIEDFKKQIAGMNSEIADYRGKADECLHMAVVTREKIEPSVDESAIRERIKGVDEINRKVRENARRRELDKSLAEWEAKAEKLSGHIAALDEERLERISDCRFPVKGLGVGDEGVLFNGLPLSQASSAEQLRVSVGIGLALNPELRVLLIRDGSLLDEQSLAMVAEMAESADAQVWVERVADGDPACVVIEDGRVSARPVEDDSPVLFAKA